MEFNKQSRTLELAGATVFGALAAILIHPIRVPFPLLPWLVFDIAEIPVLFALITFGPRASIISALVMWLTLNFTGTFVPIGPLMRLAATTSLLIGFLLGLNIGLRLRGWVLPVVTALFFSTLSRIAIMSLANFILLVFIAPEFVDFAITKGFVSGSDRFVAIIAILWFTAIFNILQNLVTGLPSLSLGRIIFESKRLRISGLPWLLQKLQYIRSA